MEEKSYKVNQYCQKKEESLSDIDNIYMTRINDGIVKSRPNVATGIPDNCVFLDNFFAANITYYLHVQIKQELTQRRNFDVFLVKYDEYNTEQYLGSIEVDAGDGVAHFECTFTPLMTSESFFNAIVFKTNTRDSVILFQELYKVENIITSALPGESRYKNFVKLGIQADYKTKFCINGELISVGKSDIYEIYNENIRVYSFSCLSPCLEDISFTKTTCVFNVPKTRKINAFILDYMYED